jgi:hypothetical protein
VSAKSSTKMTRLDAVKAYIQCVDHGDFPTELFTPDFEFYFPKFGIGRGLASFLEMASGMRSRVTCSTHRHETLRFFDAGNIITVEGTTEGVSTDDVEWCGGKTPGGRFCSVFEFNDADVVKRMYIYLDPDFTGADKERFLWPQRTRNEW